MNTLVEYIQKKHITERELKDLQNGERTVVDDVPCTVILNNGLYVYLMSDLYVGNKGGKPSFKTNDEVNYTNFAFYTWTTIPDIPKEIEDAGWGIPSINIWFKSIAADNVKTYMSTSKFMVCSIIWCKNGRIKTTWNLKTDELSHEDEGGVRFVKIVKL